MELKECEMLCMKNCSRTAFGNLDTRDGGSGCLLWFSELIDVRNFTENGQDIYFRMAASELESESPDIVQIKRNRPFTGSSGVLKLSSPGILVPVDHKNTTDGNGHNDPDNILWQSFDYPGDTLIPGHYAYQLGPYGYHELILREDSVIKYRTAPWNGIQFSGMHNLNPTYDFVLDNDDEVYYGYKLLNSSTLFRLALTRDGFGLSCIGSDGNQGWVVYLISTTDICDKYGICGPNGACIGDIFKKYSGVKLPSTEQSWYNTSMNLKECEMMCMNNCSCTAFSNLDVRDGGRGCLIWFSEMAVASIATSVLCECKLRVCFEYI
ncbi:PREDICTED: G-type lectin S-receptor [Prunus dulcis]|uniref:PREDICTED: G-type lectin S-receptor n=1 Tax=Prunus dulcis TaxID=3755 RepID=A0A5E4FUJ9_PRUDU|nr:hypothetical protein L3X38_028485 [Prunus dulcis]VVA31153.1 PREDICTED: G-type lectin S-receptor [Prunus dulcis]